jgi:cyclic pyranopterin monophosphate synthase
MEHKLSHMDGAGRSRMVDVGGKEPTARRAVAEARVRISAALQQAIEADTLGKGNLMETARLAGIMAAKRTDQIIPLCHSLPIDHVDVQARLGDGCIYLRAEAATTARTGVEMEALTAVAVAALTVIDMGKAVDPAMVVENLRLVEKRGGRRGHIQPHPSEFPE